MDRRKNVKETDTPNEISVKDIFTSIKGGVKYILSKWMVVVLITILGASGGLLFSILKKPTYSAVCTFVLEDGSKGGGLGQISGLASLAGLDIGGGGGLFQGDNIIELYKSRLMIEKTLLSEVVINGKKQLLIDQYINFNHLRPKWRRHDDIDSISFYGNPVQFNRHQDSIVTDIVEEFNKKNLTVEKPDKKLSIIDVTFTSKDEVFAKEFTNKLVETVNEFFAATKTKKSAQNVRVLQHQADSVKAILNSSINGVASAIDAAPNANPQQLSLRVPSQKKQVDVQASTAIYSEIVKNLEISKISLQQEAPLIQVIDQPIMPLKMSRVSKTKGILIGAALGFFLTVFVLTIKNLVS